MPAPPPPNEAGGCWKELPETLAKKKAIWNPRNEDHRCFMWCVLAHCLGALADAGVDFSGLPTDRPVGFDDIDAFELRNAGRRSSSSCGSKPCGRTGWSITTFSSSAPRAARTSSSTPCCFCCTAATTA